MFLPSTNRILFFSNVSLQLDRLSQKRFVLEISEIESSPVLCNLLPAASLCVPVVVLHSSAIWRQFCQLFSGPLLKFPIQRDVFSFGALLVTSVSGSPCYSFLPPHRCSVTWFVWVLLPQPIHVLGLMKTPSLHLVLLKRLWLDFFHNSSSSVFTKDVLKFKT